MSQEFVCSLEGADPEDRADGAAGIITAESPSEAARIYASRIDFAACGIGRKQRTGVGGSYAVDVVVSSYAGTWVVTVVGAPVRWGYGVRKTREILPPNVAYSCPNLRSASSSPLSTLESREFWCRVDAAAAAVRSWPAWKRGEWQEYPATRPMAGRDTECADDDCEEWVGWLDIPPKQTVRVTGRIRRVLSREEVHALLAEGKRIADEKRRERMRRERDPERAV